MRMLAASLTIAVLVPAVRAEDLGKQAHEILNNHCYKCHGKDGAAKGGVNYILDRDKLVSRNKVVPKNPDDSSMFQRIVAGEMPPAAVKKRLDQKEIDLLKRWIEAGAPAEAGTVAGRDFISETDIVFAIWTDLKAMDARDRKHVRYLTLANVVNSGAPEKEVQEYRKAISKLMNSLSWHRKITVPKAIDKQKTLYRIDLRDYLWNRESWIKLLTVYPHYLPIKSKEAKWNMSVTGTELPYIRADWFVATASRPPLYHDLLNMPFSDRELERQLRVDVLQNIQDERIARSGFNGSGVARNNRVLERHESAYGVYWRSYDFSDNNDRQNVFERPLGPIAGGAAFEQAGGEMIFSLPNGLHGFFIVDANGRRLDRAPVEIVSDPKRPDKVVETGVSCMNCHSKGFIHKADQVRGHAEKNANAFSKEDAGIIRALYPVEAAFKKLLDDDNDRYTKALKLAEAVADEDPVVKLTLRYEGELDHAGAAAELGLRPEEFTHRLNKSATLTRTLGQINAKGGTVQRQVFLTVLPDLVREFGLGDGLKPLSGIESPTPIVEAKPFAGHKGNILCVTFSADGKRAVTGSDDGTARFWDVKTGHEIRPLEGHTDEVLAVAISSDGKIIVTGSADRTVRIWDATSGRQLKSLEAHTERVSCVAISKDGKRVVSGSWDNSISIWDVESGKEVARMNNHTSYVSSLTFSADDTKLLSTSYDKTVRLWDVEKAKELAVLKGHTKEVFCADFSADGTRVVSGGDDNTVRIWDLKKKEEIAALKGHGRAVIRVAFAKGDTLIISAGSQYQTGEEPIRVWDVAKKATIKTFGKKEDTVWSAAVSPNGRWLLAGQTDKTLRLWDLRELYYVIH